ncbi:MAG TPA: hypothetical protein VFX35_10725 [Solirubrobacterales bacterium]|nr:hypothetical protein [Solirubrobacterales bacterium]
MPGSADRTLPASSETARAFGAEISITDGQALFYVVARKGTPDAAVRSAGGEIVTRLHSALQALALAPLSAHLQLRDHPDLAVAGPVTIDPDRFERFTTLIGMSRK